jgi:hypothetical protein
MATVKLQSIAVLTLRCMSLQVLEDASLKSCGNENNTGLHATNLHGNSSSIGAAACHGFHMNPALQGSHNYGMSKGANGGILLPLDVASHARMSALHIGDVELQCSFEGLPVSHAAAAPAELD